MLCCICDHESSIGAGGFRLLRSSIWSWGVWMGNGGEGMGRAGEGGDVGTQLF